MLLSFGQGTTSYLECDVPANQFLALMEPDKGNLDTIRQEMILHILKLKKLLTK